MSVKKIVKIAYIAVGSFLLCGIIIALLLANNQKTKITPESAFYHATDFKVNGQPVESLPVVIKCAKGDSFTLSGRLPENLPSDFALCYLAEYTSSAVFADGKQIGGYGADLPLPFGRMVGNIRVIVPIDQSLAGHEFTIVFNSYYKYSVDINEPTLASRGSIEFSVLLGNIPRLIIIAILATVMFIAIAIMFSLRRNNSAISSTLVFYFVAFDLNVLLWLICSSDLPQFITDSNAVVSLISFLALSFMAIPFAGYCGQVYAKRRQLFDWLQLIGLCIPAIILTGYMFNLFDPLEILLLTHAYIIAAVGTGIVISIIELHTNREAIHIVIGIALLTVAAAVGLFCYYKAPSQGLDGIMFGIGCVAFVISLFMVIVIRQVKLVEEQKYIETYKELAFMDIMTGLQNRSSFENSFDTMSDRVAQGDPVTLFIFDINSLKSTNDSYGHQQGDSLIIALARVIKKEFERYGNCFRLGGDEFAVLIEGSKLDVRTLKVNFKDVLSQLRTDDGSSVSAAVGYATMPYLKDTRFRNELFNLADRAMYADKDQMKSMKCHEDVAH